MTYRGKKVTPGARFGRLVVVEYAGKRKGRFHWLCKCDCGGQKVTATSNLTGGGTQSCGCLQRERAGPNGSRTTHNLSNTPEYATWQSIKQRCFNKNNRAWIRYGGRGITMAEEWVDSFESFFEHVGPKPSAKHSIDRIDNDGNYEPGNVRWATSKQQRNNRRDQTSSSRIERVERANKQDQTKFARKDVWIWRGKLRYHDGGIISEVSNDSLPGGKEIALRGSTVVERKAVERCEAYPLRGRCSRRAEKGERFCEKHRYWRANSSQNRNDKTNTLQTDAYRAVRKALRDGSLEYPDPPICASCGKKTRLVAHHEDFEQPLDVIWLCHRCVFWKTRGEEPPPTRKRA